MSLVKPVKCYHLNEEESYQDLYPVEIQKIHYGDFCDKVSARNDRNILACGSLRPRAALLLADAKARKSNRCEENSRIAFYFPLRFATLFYLSPCLFRRLTISLMFISRFEILVPLVFSVLLIP